MDAALESLVNELRVKIIATLNLIDVTPEDIVPEAPLVGGDLGIDSIDILELVMMIEKDYAVKVDSKEMGEKVFASLKAMAAHIREQSPQLA